MKKKVLILYFTQFGYHTDSYMYAKYADREQLDLHYCCFDMGLKRIDLQGITVFYVPLKSSRIKSYLLFFFESKKYINLGKFDLIFHIDSRFSIILRVLNLFKPMVLDIRTGDLSDNKLKLWFRNMQITISSLLYKRVSVISEGLLKELKINSRKTTIIPLGGERHPFAPKKFNSVRMLYVGSLNNRNIEQTILGLSYFKSKCPESDVTYDIVGFGSEFTERNINETIENTGMRSIIKFQGRKPHHELDTFFDNCNLGIVYVPQKSYYEFQPSTKLFEYALAGMAIIATNTYENRIALKEGTGVLCQDNADSFAEALQLVFDKRDKFNSDYIKDQYYCSTWESIVNDTWLPFILNS